MTERDPVLLTELTELATLERKDIEQLRGWVNSGIPCSGDYILSWLRRWVESP